MFINEYLLPRRLPETFLGKVDWASSSSRSASVPADRGLRASPLRKELAEYGLVASELRGEDAKTCGRDGRRDASIELIRPLPIGDSGLAVGSTALVGDAGGVPREEHLESKTDEGDLSIFNAVSIECLT